MHVESESELNSTVAHSINNGPVRTNETGEVMHGCTRKSGVA